jgi:DNA-binding CsgD family transcriptional regulator
VAAKEVVALLPGHPVWAPQGEAVLATVALARGDIPAAVAAAQSAMELLRAAENDDANLEIVIPVARAMFAGGPAEAQAFVAGYLRILLARIAQGTLDEGVRVRWLRGPLGRELVELAGSFDAGAPSTAPGLFDAPGIDDVDRRLLHLLTEGNTNAEMAEKVGLTEEEVGLQLARLIARLGVSNRAEATSLAFRGFAR